MTLINDAERLALITREQVRLVNEQADKIAIDWLSGAETAESRDRRAAFRRAIIIDEDDGAAEVAAFAKHRAHQRQPQRLPHVCTILQFTPRSVVRRP